MPTHFERHRGEFVVSTDRNRLDIDRIHRFLSTTYWAFGIPRETMVRSFEHSLCFGLYGGAVQVGFARVLTDYAHAAYLADVFVLPDFRGRGLAQWLLASVMSHPDLQDLRRWRLSTRDAHGLYRKFGFVAVSQPERYMEIRAECSFGEKYFLDSPGLDDNKRHER